MILVIEDNEAMCSLLATILRNEGYDVLCTYDGPEAVKAFKRRKDEITLVVSDLQLPKLDGVETYRLIRRIVPEMKAIFVSGYFDERSRRELQQAGVQHFVTKPYTPDDILTSVHAVLG